MYQKGTARVWLKGEGNKHIYKVINDLPSGTIIIYLTLENNRATQEVFDNDGRQVTTASLQNGVYTEDLKHIEFAVRGEDHSGMADWTFFDEGYVNSTRIVDRENHLLWQQSLLAEYQRKE